MVKASLIAKLFYDMKQWENMDELKKQDLQINGWKRLFTDIVIPFTFFLVITYTAGKLIWETVSENKVKQQLIMKSNKCINSLYE